MVLGFADQQTMTHCNTRSIYACIVKYVLLIHYDGGGIEERCKCGRVACVHSPVISSEHVASDSKILSHVSKCLSFFGWQTGPANHKKWDIQSCDINIQPGLWQFIAIIALKSSSFSGSSM